MCLLFTSVSFVSNSWADAKIMKCKSKDSDAAYIYKLKNNKVFIRKSGWKLLKDYNKGEDKTYNWEMEDKMGTYKIILDFKYLQVFYSSLYKGNMAKYSNIETIDCTKIE